MRVAVFIAKKCDRKFLTAANESHGHSLEFFETRQTKVSAPVAREFPAVSIFVNDVMVEATLTNFAITVRRSLRCAGFNNVDLSAAPRRLTFPNVLVTGHQAFSRGMLWNKSPPQCSPASPKLSPELIART